MLCKIVRALFLPPLEHLGWKHWFGSVFATMAGRVVRGDALALLPQSCVVYPPLDIPRNFFQLSFHQLSAGTGIHLLKSLCCLSVRTQVSEHEGVDWCSVRRAVVLLGLGGGGGGPVIVAGTLYSEVTLRLYTLHLPSLS